MPERLTCQRWSQISMNKCQEWRPNWFHFWPQKRMGDEWLQTSEGFILDPHLGLGPHVGFFGFILSQFRLHSVSPAPCWVHSGSLFGRVNKWCLDLRNGAKMDLRGQNASKMEPQWIRNGPQTRIHVPLKPKGTHALGGICGSGGGTGLYLAVGGHAP